MSPAEPFVVMAKPVGARCNLDCSYCYYLPKAHLFPAGERFRMRPEVLEAYIASAIAAVPGPVVHFAWHGGEPTLAGLGFFRRVVELQARHLPSGWRCVNNLQTNGTLLDDTWCRFLAEHGFAVGISIDGPARLHDTYRRDRRGRPTHDRVLRGLRRLRAAGIEPDVLCTLNATNAAHPLEVYRFFLDERVRWLQFLPVVQALPDGRVAHRSVHPEVMGAFLCRVFDEWVRYDVGRIGVQNFLEPLLVISGQPATLCVMAETCGRVPVLEHDGSLYACDHFVDPAHRLGDITTDRLGALLDGPEQAAFAMAKRDDLPPCCHTCPVGFLCHGGCPKDRFMVAPSGEPTLNYLCAGYRSFYGHALPFLIRIAELVRAGSSSAAIMGELEVTERAERRAWQATGRNDPCPCGSGAKYKHCCLPTRRQ
ncbi:MAG: anaerobic sulfatase maturase [Actinomycetota bacterium]|nr:anaerobic sulfatase maturase [Actinomycetota bacterium]